MQADYEFSDNIDISEAEIEEIQKSWVDPNILTKPRGYTLLLSDSKRGEDGMLSLEDHEEITPGKSIIIRDERARLFYKFESIAHYLHHYPADMQKLTHEVIFGWMKQKPKFDIDNGKEENFETILEYIIAAFQETYNVIPELVICDSSKGDKFKRHIIVANCAFENATEAKYFSDEVLKPIMDGETAKCLDWGVNSRTQNFRTVDSTKEDRRKRIITDHTAEDTFITLCNHLPVLPTIAPPIVQRDFADVKEISTETWTLIREKVDKNIWEFDARQSTGNRLVFNRRKNSHCSACNREHSRANMYICIFPDSIRQFCFRNNEKKSILLWAKPVEVKAEPDQPADECPSFAEIARQIAREQYGHAELFVSAHKDRVVITDVKAGSGYMYNDKNALWEPKHDSQISMLIPPFLESAFGRYRAHLSAKYNQETRDDEKKRINDELKIINKVIRSVLTKRYVSDVFSFAKNQLYNKDFEYTKNSSAFLLPLKNCTVVDLRTGETRPRTKEDQFTFECPWNFVAEPSPKVAQYMLDLMNDRQELADFFQKALGYCITGETREKALFIMYGGSGDNGKSKLLNLLEKLLGPFYAGVGKSVFIKSNEKDRHANAHTAHLMPIVGARIISVSELSEGDVLNDGQVKNITGDDLMRLRAPGDRESTAYRPICKPLIVSNHRPSFDTKDQAMKNRIKYIPFEAQFKLKPTGSQKLANPKLIDELNGELLSDVGSWIIAGAVKYFREGLGTTDTLEQYKEAYVNELDTIGQFLAEECELGDKYSVQAGQIFNVYGEWCRSNGIKGENSKNFGMTMKGKFEPKRTKVGTAYLGLRLKPTDDADEKKQDELEI